MQCISSASKLTFDLCKRSQLIRPRSDHAKRKGVGESVWHDGAGDGGRLGAYEQHCTYGGGYNAGKITEPFCACASLTLFMQKLPDEDKQKLSEIESRNQKIFQKLEENSKSREPFWKMHK